jgi:hypothetical protein
MRKRIVGSSITIAAVMIKYLNDFLILLSIKNAFSNQVSK